MINVLVGQRRSASDPNNPWIPPGKTEPRVFDNIKLSVLEMDYLGRGLFASSTSPVTVSVKTAPFLQELGITYEDFDECFDTCFFGREISVQYVLRRDKTGKEVYVADRATLSDNKYLDFVPVALDEFAKARAKYDGNNK